MRLQKRVATFSYTFGDPIIAKPEIIVAIRRLVQNACQHDDVRSIDADGVRVECADCGYQTPGVEATQLVSAAR